MPKKHQDAPGGLETVREFVNSVDLEDGTEALSDPPALVQWLAEHDLIDPAVAANAADLRRAVDVREALRALMRANNGGDPATDAVTTLRASAQRAGVGLEFEPDGSRLEPQAGGVDGALGRLLVAVHEAQHDGTWARMKACPWDTCHWAFYDHTKNRSGVWCNMAVCGNRAKARAYRERHA
jgi:predicted RNA-binding Zn ribbon-like protein